MSPRVNPLARGDEWTRGTPVSVVTPEGVPLVFHAAPLGDRFVAVLIDLGCLFGLVLLVALLFVLAGFEGDDFAGALLMLLVFALRFGYFTTAELRRRGSTFGKRRAGIRVVDAAGGPLTAEAVVVRNLLRELELFLPLMLAAGGGSMGLGASATMRWLAVAWAFGFGFVPLFNARRMRVGDLFAGTLVVVVPRTALLDDVGRLDTPPPKGAPAAAEGPPPTLAFTDAQLDVYGEFELQVLEDVLRRGQEAGQGQGPFVAVAERIAKKIGYTGSVRRGDALPFLRAYYAALRARLEHRRLLGRGKADKHDRGPRPGR